MTVFADVYCPTCGKRSGALRREGLALRPITHVLCDPCLRDLTLLLDNDSTEEQREKPHTGTPSPDGLRRVNPKPETEN